MVLGEGTPAGDHVASVSLAHRLRPGSRSVPSVLSAVHTPQVWFEEIAKSANERHPIIKWHRPGTSSVPEAIANALGDAAAHTIRSRSAIGSKWKTMSIVL
jgi:hypothetical protein